MHHLSKLLSPIWIGREKIKNRVAMSPMISNLGTPEGYPSEHHIMYFAERAKGGVGLLITEYTYVNKVDSRGVHINQLGLYSDDLIPKFFRLTELIHSLDSKIFVQLVHVGRKTKEEAIWGNTPIAPSPISKGKVREMTLDDIKRVKEDFVKASIRAERAGFDGIELHGAHGYLIAQFLSPATNKRNDKYKDGTVFVEELIEEVKAKVNMPLGIRVSVTEFDEEGLKPEMVAEIAKRLEAKGLDYIHISAGRDGPLYSSMPFYGKRVSFLEEAKVVRKNIKIPMFLVGSIIDLEDALKALSVADVAVLGRQLLADPMWLEKVKRGMTFRPCIRCNQSCLKVRFSEVRCDVNPELGWEGSKLERGEGEVTVVGAGVMGLEASRILALRGFKVKLYEKGKRIGGQFLLFKDPWKVKEFGRLIDYYERELKRLNVEVILNREVECEHCIKAFPEEVIEVPKVEGKKVLIDSNLYPYQDYAFELSKSNEVYITERSLRELEMSRKYFLISKYNEIGVRVVNSEVNADVIIRDFRRNQPTIGESIRKGYLIGVNYKNY